MVGEEEQFAFDRTTSRILEMQSKLYLENHNKMFLRNQQK